eukprot:TRINITY_DN1691_c0_g1_i4.p1 TRINITY_DN1691_c0_g1~~TRINITY_DN1691_c0_g1_i4.p1  ORF type:complete len:114 (-),score=29.50 TRINITY_DN1691_c0_g1_i4:45-386(-)
MASFNSCDGSSNSEARHAAYLNDLTAQIPFPAAFDTAEPPATIADMISDFLVSCPDQIVLPEVPVNPPLNVPDMCETFCPCPEAPTPTPSPSHGCSRKSGTEINFNFNGMLRR